MSGRRIPGLIQRQLGRLLDPALCLGCGHSVDAAQYFCAACVLHLETLQQPCKLCGLENPLADAICAACLFDPPRWQRIIAPLVYRRFNRELLIQFKFGERLFLANSLVSRLIDYYRASQPPPEVLLPVPLHRKRLLERGYNQAFEIATVMSGLLDIPVDHRALQRTRYTLNQSGLSAAKRAHNIRQAFSFTPARSYTHVALVDDIVTTGSTVNEITKLLQRAGVARVEVWSLARVIGPDPI